MSYYIVKTVEFSFDEAIVRFTEALKKEGSGTIEVGPPVTRRPPHESRRAVFPHRALQGCSLPHCDAIPRSEVGMRNPGSADRLMFPLRATQPCRSLPHVVGSPASEDDGAI